MIRMIFIIVFIAILSTDCHTKSEDISKIKINVDSLITSVAKEVTVEFVFLSYSKEFQIIWNNPSLYSKDIMMFLKSMEMRKIDFDLNDIKKTNRNLLLHEREFVISYFMMSKLDLSKYLELSYLGYDIFKRGLLCEDVFKFIISGYYNESPILSNLQNHKVISFFRRIVDSDFFSEKFRNGIKKTYLNKWDMV